MGVEPLEPFLAQGLAQGRMDPVGIIAVLPFLGGEVLDGADGIGPVTDLLEELDRAEDLLFVRHGPRFMLTESGPMVNMNGRKKRPPGPVL